VVLVSGSGTLLQALLDAAADPTYPAQVVAVGADREGVVGLERARARGIPTFVTALGDHPDRATWDRALATAIAEHDPAVVVSAGFMKILGPAVLERFVVVNTHPALLPSFPGAHGVRDALAHGVRVTGCTLHRVDAGVDTGPIIAQRAVGVLEGDTEDTLHERIKVVERAMLVEELPRLLGRR
jgi:phosphoribosylglycinamide formyltransferase-1